MSKFLESDTVTAFLASRGVDKDSPQARLEMFLPRKIVLHPNSLVNGQTSKHILIDAGLLVQLELGPPVPGTYRRWFYGDETPRRDIDELPLVTYRYWSHR